MGWGLSTMPSTWILRTKPGGESTVVRRQAGSLSYLGKSLLWSFFYCILLAEPAFRLNQRR